jgi:hypothetical protein
MKVASSTKGARLNLEIGGRGQDETVAYTSSLPKPPFRPTRQQRKSCAIAASSPRGRLSNCTQRFPRSAAS